jgi:poly-gamma-glutamate synthesis protein (capsule biosynthesis protein)
MTDLEPPGPKTVTLFVCGDVMVGRGIDQLLAHPSEPTLRERYLLDARDYVTLAEEAHGAIQRPVDPSYVWGDALEELQRVAPDARLINLETSITTSEHYSPDKGIHYRLHPGNVGCLTAARVSACALANNHLLDFGRDGLLETLTSLGDAGIRFSGAGRDASEAAAPARLGVPGKGNLLFLSVGSTTSGIPNGWSAQKGLPGVAVLEDLSKATAHRVAEHLRSLRRVGDLCIVSIHWGGNWGFQVPREHTEFARALIDLGVDLIHGHSAHHPRPIELYRGKLILYDCGDFINDYEGISGYEALRSDLRLMYFVELDVATGDLQHLRLVPLQTHRLRLRRASPADGQWLASALSNAGRAFGTRLSPQRDGSLLLEHGGGPLSAMIAP